MKAITGAPLVVVRTRPGSIWILKLSAKMLAGGLLLAYGYLGTKFFLRMAVEIGASLIFAALVAITIVAAGFFVPLAFLKRYLARHPKTVPPQWLLNLFFREIPLPIGGGRKSTLGKLS